jgi:hypothetical protein
VLTDSPWTGSHASEYPIFPQHPKVHVRVKVIADKGKWVKLWEVLSRLIKHLAPPDPTPSAARCPLQEVFHNRIAQLVYTFPEDAKTSQGANFWSAPKRFPSALDFDPTDPLHLQCIRAGANLKAEVHGIERPALDDAGLAALVAAVPVAQFVPKAGVTIETGTYARPPTCVGWSSCAHTTAACAVHTKPLFPS